MANEPIVTREHREAACHFHYPWLKELPNWTLSWIGGNEESAGLSLELTRVAKLLAEAEHRGRVRAESETRELQRKAWGEGYDARCADTSRCIHCETDVTANPYETQQPIKES